MLYLRWLVYRAVPLAAVLAGRLVYHAAPLAAVLTGWLVYPGAYRRVAKVVSEPPKTKKAGVLLRFWLKMSKNAFFGTEYFKNSRRACPRTA